MNPYLRAAQAIPAIREQAIAALDRRQQQPEPVRARNPDGTFMADDPTTPDVDEAWVQG